MPFQSKYDPDQITALSEQMLTLLADQQVPVDLALMALGNALSNVVNEHVPAGQRKAITEQFARTLLQSVSSADD